MKPLKDWQLPIVNLLLSDKVTENNPLRAREAWHHTMSEGKEIGRVSVIFFLQELTKLGLINQDYQTGRGGYHGVYWASDALAQSLKKEIVCEGCGKKHWLPEENEEGVPYSFLRCNCGHENPLQSFQGSAIDG